MRFVVIRDDSDVNVHQWSFSQGTVIAISLLSIILFASILFFTTEFLTQFLYQAKLREVREKNQSLVAVLTDLQTNLDLMQKDMAELEDKDKALRTYANLPLIDQDIRRVGVGGSAMNRTSNLETLVPDIDAKILDIEMNGQIEQVDIDKNYDDDLGVEFEEMTRLYNLVSHDKIEHPDDMKE